MGESSSRSGALSNESLLKLRSLFLEQAEKGNTIFHQAHAEELLRMANELIAFRDRTTRSERGRIVPEFPTAKMLDAGMELLGNNFELRGDGHLEQVYRAMLTAAPSERNER